MADIMAKTIKFPGLNNTYEFMQPDGTYPDLTAGNIISNDAYNEDTEPYLFRALPYKSKRLEEDLVGATVNWNQLVQNGDFADTSNWQILNATISVADNAMRVVRNSDGITSIYQVVNAHVNHKYLWTSEVKGDDAYTDWVMSFGSSELYTLPITTTWNKITKIVNKTSTSVNFNAIRKNSGTSGDVVYIRNAMLIDLTAMFGSTIADYVYTLEQGTVGAGVAWLKSYGFFTEPYYEYNAGTLKSVNPTAHVTRGVNAWDEEWELGYYKSDGTKESASHNICCTNRIPVLANTEYYCKTPYTYGLMIYALDVNGNVVGDLGYKNNTTFTTPNNCAYIVFYSNAADNLSSYNGGVCINISDPTINGKYFQYEEHTYDLGNVPLYGLFQLVGNKLKAYGDVRHAEGGTDRKFMLVDLGTLDWNAPNASGRASSTSDIGAKTPLNGDYVSLVSLYQAITPQEWYAASKNGVTICGAGYGGDGRVGVVNSSFIGKTAAEIKTAMSGVYLLCEKATTTTEDTPSFEKIQSCFPNGIEEYITTNGVPVGHDTKYYTDVISNIAGIPEPPSGNGTYELKLTVTDGVASYSWVAV